MTNEPDPHAVPGLEPSDGRRPLDMSQDPDRFDPDAGFDPEEHPRIVEPAPRTPRRLGAADDPDRFDPAAPELPPELPRGLDPDHDPDRFLPPGQGQSLPELLGKAGTYEGDRDGYQWVFGLLGVLAFLALVAFLFGNVLTP